MLNDRKKNFSRLVNKIFMRARVPLFAVQGNSYSDSHYHSQQFRYIPSVWAYTTSYDEIRQLRILKWQPIREPNPETGSQDPGITNFSIPDPVIAKAGKYTCKKSFQRKLDFGTYSALNSNTLSVIGVGSVMRLADILPNGCLLYTSPSPRD